MPGTGEEWPHLFTSTLAGMNDALELEHPHQQLGLQPLLWFAQLFHMPCLVP